MRKGVLIFLITSLFTQNISAQAPAVEWAKQIRSSANEEPYGMAFDSAGNVYTTGYYGGYTDFDPGPATFTLAPGGARDIFVSKLDSSGNFVWAIGIRGAGQLGTGKAYAIKLDKWGYIYITGIFDDWFDFDPSPATFNMYASFTYSNIFIAKYDPSGNFVWAKQFGAGMQSESVRDMAIDGSGSIYLSGVFKSTVDFDPSASAYLLTATGTTEDTYISKFDSSGNFIWARQIGGTDYTDAVAITIDSTANIYATGQFAGTTDFDPGAATVNLSSSSSNYEDFFVFSLDSAGNFNWVKKIGVSSGQEFADDIAIDRYGNIYMAGTFFDTVDFDPGPGVFNLSASGLSEHEMFILKLDVLGNFKWAKKVGYDINSRINSIAVDTVGNVCAAGRLMHSIDIDPGPAVFTISPYGGNLYSDAFVFKLDTAGNFVWAKSLGGNLSEGADVIEFNYDNKPYIGGYFSSTPAYFGSIALSNTANSPGDMFILRLGTINTGFENDFKENSIFISPNPFTDNVTIQSQKYLNNEPFTIIDNAGRIIRRGKLNHETSEINLKGVAKGIYFLQTGNYNENTFKLVKQ